MNKETLSRIENDIASGNLGKARDRLHGLLATYPDALELRRMLGDVYARLQQPAMAGRYWYLEEKSPEMVKACQAFENSCGHDPVQMLLALKFRGDIAAICDTFAGSTLLALQEQGEKERDLRIEFGRRGREKYRYRWDTGRRSGRVIEGTIWQGVGCLLIVLIVLALAIVGLVSVLQWLF
jgi:hypothetical protein